METPWYREFAPCAELRPHVRAFFTYTWAGEATWSALFADAGLSIAVSLSGGLRIEDLWTPRAAQHAYVAGPMTSFRRTEAGERLAQFGAYLRPGSARRLLGAPASAFTNRIVDLRDVWGNVRIETAADLEAALLRRARAEDSAASLNVYGLAEVLSARPETSIQELADCAGVSRQYLARVFREQAGVTPKVFARLSRFRRAIRAGGDWARTAFDAGYADQSHMIADFREFAGSTPEAMRRQGRFHPFAARLTPLPGLPPAVRGAAEEARPRVPR